MLMMLKESEAMLELMTPAELWDPYVTQIRGCRLAGEEKQEPESFSKSDLAFLSGESLPRCWVNPHYRDQEWQTYRADTVNAAAVAGPASYYGA